jgi:colanic acid biosynthesis glycosyl transferase WcaI
MHPSQPKEGPRKFGDRHTNARSGTVDRALRRTMNILAVVHHFPPDVNSTGLLMAQLFERLVEEGHQVSVVTTFPHYEGFRTWDEYRGKLCERSSYRGIDVLRVYSYTSGNKGMRHRLTNYLSFNALASLLTVCSSRTFDLVFCTNGSFFSGLTGYALGRTRRAPVVYNVQDLYPEVPVVQRQIRSPRAIAALERIERFMYARATHISVIAPSFRRNLVEKGVPKQKISVIPNFVDVEFIRPLPRQNQFSSRMGLCDRFVVAHAGNLGYVYDLETLLTAAAKVATLDPAVLFLIVGDGVAKAGLERKAQELRLGNVRFLPFQPREELPLLRASCDVHVSLYRRDAAAYSMPSKVYEIMASGRPLLASADGDSDVRRLVDDTKCGICVEPEDAGQLTDAIVRLRRNAARRAEMARRGRREAEETYSKEAVLASYDELFRSLIPRSLNADEGPSGTRGPRQ